MSKKVLVVDDEGDIVQFVRLCLEREGFEVSTACSGRDALNHVAFDRPDLIVLDWTMPGMDGVEVVKQLRENESTADIRIMIMSANIPEAVRASGTVRADYYWSKPLIPKALTTFIKKIFSRRSQAY
jgi:DNA-binding response OmpR family regulator